MQNLGRDFPDPDFETDACTFHPGDTDLLFSTDEFSSEDNFRCHNPADLGWNLAAATISDIHAAGGIPAFYGHSVTIQHDWDDRFVQRFSEGIASCLSATGASFIGGDLGLSDHWKYTGIAIGKKLASLGRRGAQAGDAIYITGNIGAGNLEAALKLYSDKPLLKPLLNMVSIRFTPRTGEAVLVRKYANCCIDSSDGVFRALLDLSGLAGLGFRVADLPYDSHGLTACKILGMPSAILFIGECGEYELVFTVSPEREGEFLSEAADLKLSFTKLGEIKDNQEMILIRQGKLLDLRGYSLFARNFPDVREYINEVVKFINYG